MQIGIVGLLYSGKSTLFSTLLAHQSSDSAAGHHSGMERGVIKVPDYRLERLTEMFNPRKKVPATIEYLKVAGLEKDARKGDGLPPQFLANVKTTDVILLVIRAFENDLYPHPLETVDPARDIAFIEEEFLFSDLAIIENRLQKLEKMVLKTQDEKDKRELAVLTKLHTCLESEQPLRTVTLDEHEELIIKGFQFLTRKPVLYVLNIGEEVTGESEAIVKQYAGKISPGCTMTALSAEIEKEISQLDAEDAAAFLADLNISEAATSKLIRASYELLGLQSFFTVGDDECRSWTIPRGTTAHKAAGVIHSDLEKGFIRAEVVSYEDLVRLGSLHACKEKGILRLEGKEYIVRDGDVLNIRFNV
jgi:GTP-binding protein YchF